jgi:hypothetical protein
MSNPNVRQDDSGQWWHHFPSNGQRARCALKTCPTCLQVFPAYAASKTAFCDPACYRAVCVRCEEEYQPTTMRQRYCSVACRTGAAICELCGITFVASRHTEKRFCSSKCFYDTAMPVGTLRPCGAYILIKVSPETPGARRFGPRSNWMYHHRFVMQESVGRPLLRSETVHHINAIKTDNRLENLQLRQGNHGKGAAFACLDCGSHRVAAVRLK